MRSAIILFFLIFTITLRAQSLKTQLIGRVVDIHNNEGVEGVEIQLISTGAIKFTDSEGKFKFEQKNGFVTGEPNYSFLIKKEGYLTVGSTNNRVVFGSGAIENLTMKKDTDKFLWINVLNAKTGEFLKNVRINIKGEVRITDEFGKVSYDFSKTGLKRVTVSTSKDCFKDEIKDIDARGENYINLIPICEPIQEKNNSFNVKDDLYILDRAIQSRDGTMQGQNKALENLIAVGYKYDNANFNGISFEGAKLTDTDFSLTSFKVSNLKNTDFSRTKMQEANFNFADLKNSSFENVNAQYSYLQFIEGRNTNFNNADLYRSSFFLSNLSGANFSNANLKGVSLAYCNLTGANFTGADLTDAYFYGSVLDKTIFKDAIIKNTDVSGAVANDISLSKTQKEGLVRSALLHSTMTIEIYGETRNEKSYNYKYPDFKAYHTKLSQLYLETDGGLRYRDDKGVKPVGALRDFSTTGQNYISQRYWFDSKFWSHANRGFILIDKLKKNINFLYKNINEQNPIEGTYSQYNELISALKKNSKNVNYKTPFYLTADSFNILLLSKGLLDTSNIKDSNWKSLALYRCNREKENLQSLNWNPLYITDYPCGYLPPEHIEFYKKWTIRRSKTLRIKYFMVHYGIKTYNLSRLKEQENKDGKYIFRTFKNNYEGISSSFFQKNKKSKINWENTIKFNGKYTTGFLKMPFDKTGYYINLSKKSINKILNKVKDLKGDDRTLDFDIKYKLEDIKSLANDSYTLDIIPIEAQLMKNGVIYWKGSIFKEDSK